MVIEPVDRGVAAASGVVFLGLALVQTPEEARHPSMPATALREDHVDAALTMSELVRTVPALAQGQKVKTSAPRASL
jgi:hypothetical protein